MGDRERDALVYFDKLPVKKNYKKLGVRCVPPGVARYGSFLGRGVILMPSFVNIGAYVDEGTMIDTWATVGSCAQIGKGVHLSGGVGIGGVLEPPQAMPVIVEDGAFVGSRCIVVEGVRVGARSRTRGGRRADRQYAHRRRARKRTRDDERAHSRRARSLFPGTLPKRFPAGEFGTPCALIVGERAESTDQKNVAQRGAARFRGCRMNPRVLEIPGSLIRTVAAKKKPTSIDLGLGEPSLSPNLEHFTFAMEAVAKHGIKYSANAGNHDLRESIARYYHYPDMHSAANVCVTTGSQEAMYVTLKTLLDPAKDELLVVEPAFPAYVKMATLENVAVRSVAMLEDDDFAIDADRILEAIGDKTRAIVICSPSNPTGRIFSRDSSGVAGSRARQARRRADLADSRRDLPRADIHDRCRIFGRIYPYTIVTNSLSKSNALTGLRLGWILAPHAFVEQAIKAHAWVTSCADSFAQNVALHVFTTLEGVREHAPWYIEQRRRSPPPCARAACARCPSTAASTPAFACPMAWARSTQPWS